MPAASRMFVTRKRLALSFFQLDTFQCSKESRNLCYKTVENKSAALLLRFIAVQCEQFVKLKKI